MSDVNYEQHVRTLLARAGHTVQANGNVTLSLGALSALLSSHNVDATGTFVRLQRMAGIQTVRFASASRSNVDLLAERMVDHSLVSEHDKVRVADELRQRVVDILPLVDERLFSVCAGHVPVETLGLATNKPL